MQRPDIYSQRGINNIYDNIVHTLNKCALKTIKQKGSQAVRKFWWDKSASMAKRESKKHFELWKKANKPKPGNLFMNKIKAHKMHKKCIASDTNELKNKFSSNCKRI